MAKGIYVGIGTNTIKGNIIPTVWQELSQGISYSSSNGFYLTGNTYNSVYTRYASNACDGNTSTYFQSGSITCTLTLQCPRSIKITKMKVAIGVGASNNTYTISGSNNGSTYTEIYSGTGTGNTLTEITITNPGYYTYYKIDAPGRSGVYSSIYEIRTSEYEENLGKVTKAYVGVETYVGTDDNLVVNGNFRDGLEGWTIEPYGTATLKTDDTYGNYVSSVWSSTSNAAVVATENQLSDGTGGIFYMCCNARGYSSNTGTVRIYSHQSSINISNNDTWGFYSKRITSSTITNLNNTKVQLMQYSATSTGNKLDITNIGLYNLTAIYGSGNEPTKEWCDANLVTLKSVARKVIKGYIGVNNVARLFYSAETIE